MRAVHDLLEADIADQTLREDISNAQPVDFQSASFVQEREVAQKVIEYADQAPTNDRALCQLQPEEFQEKVINGNVAVCDGDWVQPLYAQVDGKWLLNKFEVLFRLTDAKCVPYPAFVDWVVAASDQSPKKSEQLQGKFCDFAVAVLLRVDARVGVWSAAQREAALAASLLTTLNFTTKQLEAAIAAPVKYPELLGLEETEYDNEPAGLSELRLAAWRKFASYSLDDVKPSQADVAALGSAFADAPPLTPQGKPFKVLPARYNHDFSAARQFIADFRRARAEHPEAKGDFKLAEDFCCYLIGVGYAPFARASLAEWRERNPEASAGIRRLGLELIKEALDAGLHVVLEVSFEDEDVAWLHEAIPDLGGRLLKQGGLSGPRAVPHSLLGSFLPSPS